MQRRKQVIGFLNPGTFRALVEAGELTCKDGLVLTVWPQPAVASTIPERTWNPRVALVVDHNIAEGRDLLPTIVERSYNERMEVPIIAIFDPEVSCAEDANDLRQAGACIAVPKEQMMATVNYLLTLEQALADRFAAKDEAIKLEAELVKIITAEDAFITRFEALIILDKMTR